MISQATFGPDGALVVDPDTGYAKVEIEYDDQNRRTEMRYMGADGSLRTSDVAVRRFQYDAEGNPVTDEFDQTGALIEKTE